MNASIPDVTMGHLLEEYATLEYILLGDVRDLLDDPVDETTCKWLLAVLDALLDTLPREFALRDSGGYLSEVLELYPNWSGQVDHLRSERDLLYEKLQQLRQRVAQDASFTQIAADLRGDLCDWMQSFVAHHRHERRIVHVAYTLDVGTGD